MGFKKKATILLAIILLISCLGACAEKTKAQSDTSLAPSAVSDQAVTEADTPTVPKATYDNSGESKTTSAPTNDPSSLMTSALGEISFKNTLNWETPYIYFWSDTDNKMTTWPGVPMTLSSDNTYTYTIPANAGYIIFNDGYNTQTVDIIFDGSVAEYQLSNEQDEDGKYYAATMNGERIDAATAYDSTVQVSDSNLGITVVRAGVIEGYYSNTFTTTDGYDAVVFEIKNDTTDTLKSLTLYVVFADANGNTIRPFGGFRTNDINVLTTRDTVIEPGETKEVAYKCDASTFESFDSVVASYVVGRTNYENTDAIIWAQRYL